MKIALVCKKFFIERGGLERYTVRLSRALLHEGHEVHVFANTWQAEPDIVFHHVPILRMSSPVKNLSFAHFCKRRLSGEAFDVIQSMERIFRQDIYRVSDGISPVHLLQRYSDPLIRRFKSAGPRRLALSYLEQRIFSDQGSRFVMTNSNLVRQQVMDYYGVPREKTEVIYNSVDLSRFSPNVRETHRASMRKKYGIGKSELLLLFVGNDFKRKGLDLVLDAMTLLKDRDIRLMVVGNDCRGSYRARAEKKGLGRSVLFLGHRKDIENDYAAADIFVFPTAYDAFANVCLEAMACGVPVITSDTNGAAELIQNGVQGYVLASRSPEELAERIALLKNASARDAMGRAAAETASHFTMKQHLSELMRLYEKVRHHKRLTSAV